MKAAARGFLAKTAQEFAEMHIRTVMFANWHHKPNGADLAGCQPLCRCIGAISRLLRGFHDAAARFRADLGIAVERPADGRLRNAQQLRQLFQVHVCHSSMRAPGKGQKPLLIFPKRFRFLTAPSAFLNRK